MSKIIYIPDNKVIDIEENLTILQHSLKNQIPHKHVCNGEAQCSTCRIEILEGLENLSSRNSLEERLAKRKGWDEKIRLACQTIPLGDIKIRRLVIDDYDAQIAQNENSQMLSGVLKEIVVFFLDIRNFTQIIEHELPYDVIFSLNRLFNISGDIILFCGGYIDKYIGDSLMGIFGLDEKPTLEFCMDAIYAIIKIKEKIEENNRYLEKNQLPTFSIRIGIALGKAVVGYIGHRNKIEYTAIGNVVNLASRLESANKKTNTDILISESLYQLLKNKIIVSKKFKLKLKGFESIQNAYHLIDLQKNIKDELEHKFFQKNEKSNQLYAETNHKLHIESEISQGIEIHSNLEVDKFHSQIVFQVQHLNIKITGIVRDFEIEAFYDENNFLNSRIKIIIPVISLTTFVDQRDQHLYSPDFFDSQTFPNIIFISNEIIETGQNQYTVYGSLFIRGITKTISLHLFFDGETIDPFSNKKVLFHGNTKIERELFNINYNIPFNGDKYLIGKEVDILFEMQFVKKT